MESEPLLSRQSSLLGVVDYRGRPISRLSSGGWTSALFIIGVEITERMAYCGISFNLITYLTGHLGFSTAAAAASVNSWSGASMMLPLIGAFFADSFIGRYRTIVFASLLYVTGLALLTLSAVLPSGCSGVQIDKWSNSSCPHTNIQVGLFYLSIYLVALAQGCHKPSVQAFGADQFDENDEGERMARSSFFNWWNFGMNCGMLASFLVLGYIQDNLGWGLGFGIPCAIMGVALIVFLLGSRTYRCRPLEDTSPFVRIGKGIVALASSRRLSVHHASSEGETGNSQMGLPSDELSKLADADEPAKEAMSVLRLFPIWASCLAFAIVSSQYSTMFNEQGATMDRTIGPSFKVPSAAMQSIITVVVITLIPLYDRILVPIARNLSGVSSGITQLQRIGSGLVVSTISMVVAAVVETKRLEVAREHGLVDEPNATVPMSIAWLLPQYILFGVMDVLAVIGLQEFFYDQVPDALRSLGMALYLSILGIGGFLSSFIVSMIDELTKRDGESWFNNNLNKAHLDYFYWFIGALSAVSFVLFVCSAQAYVYKKKERGE